MTTTRRGAFIVTEFAFRKTSQVAAIPYASSLENHRHSSRDSPRSLQMGDEKHFACENLMIAAEALGLNTCPLEGFDALRLSKFLGLSARAHDIVMVIAIGKKSPAHVDQPQWRRALEATVTIL